MPLHFHGPYRPEANLAVSHHNQAMGSISLARRTMANLDKKQDMDETLSAAQRTQTINDVYASLY